MEDTELTRFLIKHAKKMPKEEVLRITAGIKGSLSKEVIKMRHEED